MKKTQILQLGWGTFGLFFLLGNVCLFGYVGTHNEDFAIAGFMTIIWGTILNLMILLIFLILSFFDEENRKYWLQSVGILLLNIPIAFLYAHIGLQII